MGRILGSEPLEGRRWEAGEWDQTDGSPTRGDFVEGAESTISFWGTVEPADGRQIELVPEGEQTTDVQVIFTKFALRVANDEAGTPADQVDLVSYQTGQPEAYKVVRVDRWPNVKRHYRALVVRL